MSWLAQGRTVRKWEPGFQTKPVQPLRMVSFSCVAGQGAGKTSKWHQGVMGSNWAGHQRTAPRPPCRHSLAWLSP